jgi:hypothetical protein
MTRRSLMIATATFLAATISLCGVVGASASSRVNTAPTRDSTSAVRPRTTCELWAVVNPGAGLARAGCSGATSSGGGGGGYDVMFPEDVQSCAYNATIGSSGSDGTVPPGFAVVVGENGNADGVFVETFNSSGVEAAEGFHLIVTCGQAVSPGCKPWAVMLPAGSLARTGCPGASTPGNSGGVSYIDFTKNVRNCAYQATIGLAGDVGTTSPAFVNVDRNPGTSTVWCGLTPTSSGTATPEGFELTVTC